MSKIMVFIAIIAVISMVYGVVVVLKRYELLDIMLWCFVVICMFTMFIGIRYVQQTHKM